MPPPGYAQPPSPAHQGFMVGFSVGGGSQLPDCDGCNSESGLAFDFSIGGFLNPRLAIMYDASAVTSFHGDEDVSYALTNSVNAVAAQYWVGPKLWIKGGIGFGRAFFTGDIEGEIESGTGLTAAAGYEVSQSGNFAIDLSLRAGMVMYDAMNLTNIGVLVGFHWY